MSADGPRSLQSSAWRFVVAGGLNTLVTGAALSLLARVIDPRVAYTLVFLAGIALAVRLAGGFVFGVPLDRRAAVSYALVYVTAFLVGLAVVTLAISAGMPHSWSGLVVLVTAPLTFVCGRVLLTRRAQSDPPSEGIAR